MICAKFRRPIAPERDQDRFLPVAGFSDDRWKSSLTTNIDIGASVLLAPRRRKAGRAANVEPALSRRWPGYRSSMTFGVPAAVALCRARKQTIATAAITVRIVTYQRPRTALVVPAG